jgi:hypothetical protein
MNAVAAGAGGFVGPAVVGAIIRSLQSFESAALVMVRAGEWRAAASPRPQPQLKPQLLHPAVPPPPPTHPPPTHDPLHPHLPF